MMKVSAVSEPIVHNSQALSLLFEHCFLKPYNTCLQGGAEEPEYVPATKHNDVHRIIFTRDYFASALHEVAHWCVAGKRRRLQPDYGYWYAVDGRSAQQQAEFEQVEVKPQALEWMFSQACGSPFRVSADNVEAGIGASDVFTQAIAAQAQQYCVQIAVSLDDLSTKEQSTCQRAGIFIVALSHYYGVAIEQVLAAAQYRLDFLVSR